MENYSIKKLLAVASQLSMRCFVRDEVDVNCQWSSLTNPRMGRRRFVKLFWKKLNELTQRAFRGCSPDCLTLDSLKSFVSGIQYDNLKFADMKLFCKISLPNQSYIFSESQDGLMITAVDMDTFPVTVPISKMMEMLEAFNDYLANDINSLVTSALTACHAKVKGDELLTMTAKSLLSDMLEGRSHPVNMRQHKDRIYCEVRNGSKWGTRATFRTTLETLREDFKLACHKAKISICTRSGNKKLLAETAKNNPVYEVFAGADFLDKVDILPVMWHGKPTGRELKWEGDIMNTFDISSESMEDDLDDVSFYTGEKEFRYMHSSDLQYVLCFGSVSKEHPLVLPICGKPVKFTLVRFQFSDIPMGVGEDRENIYYLRVNMELVSEDFSVVLFLKSIFSEYLSFGKQTDISNPVFGKYYRSMASAMEELGLEYVPQESGRNKRCLKASRGATKLYAKGLHSLISYAVGSSNYAETQKADVYVGTILHRFPDHIDGGKLENFSKAHQIWCRKLNSLRGFAPNMTMIETPFIYQDVFSGENADLLPERVKALYGL